MRYRSHRADPIILVGLSAAFTLYYGWKGFEIFGQAQKTLKWRPVDGQIIRSDIDSREVRTRYGWRTEYRPDIEYTYRIGTREYLGRRPFFGADHWRQSDDFAREVTGRYPARGAIKVYVDVARPEETVLERGHDKVAQRHMLFAAVGVLATIVSLWLSKNTADW